MATSWKPSPAAHYPHPFFLSSFMLVVATGQPNTSNNSMSVTSSSSWLSLTNSCMFWTSWNLTNLRGISFSPLSCSTERSISCTSTFYSNILVNINMKPRIYLNRLESLSLTKVQCSWLILENSQSFRTTSGWSFQFQALNFNNLNIESMSREVHFLISWDQLSMVMT